MNCEYRQKITIELTECEASCLLNWVLSMESMVGDNPQQDNSAMAAMLYARLVEAFPTLMENDNVISFLKQQGQRFDEYENVPTEKALVSRHGLLKKIELDLQAMKDNINAELAKLHEREISIENSYIHQVLQEAGNRITEVLLIAEVERRIKANAGYQIIKERKDKLKSDLAMISKEMATLSETPRDNPQERPLALALPV